MLGIENLEIAKKNIEKKLASRIKTLDFNDLTIRIRVTLQEGNIVYLYFNL